MIVNGVEFVPQYYWGNINTPKIVVLGKNPSLRIEPDKHKRSDFIDNCKFEPELTENLNITNASDRTKIINNYLFRERMKTDSYVGYWWNKSLGKLMREKNLIGDDICIFNISGEYSKTTDNKPETKLINNIKINNLSAIEHIKNLINNKTVNIYIMWKKSISWWEEILGIKFDSDGIIDRVNIVNGKCSCNIYLSAAIKYKDFLQ